MQAIILVGGFGTRLRPLTNNLPKAVIPMMNKPFLTYQLKLLAKHGIDELILCVYHQIQCWGYVQMVDTFVKNAKGLAEHSFPLDEYYLDPTLERFWKWLNEQQEPTPEEIEQAAKEFALTTVTPLEEYAALGDKIVRYTDETYSSRAMVLEPWSISPKGKALIFWGKVKKDKLYQNYPNPFNPETWMPFSIAKQASISIQIYNPKGQLVRKIDLGNKEPGLYLSKEKAGHWDGKNQSGEPVSSGIYYYSIKASDFSETRKMISIK